MFDSIFKPFTFEGDRYSLEKAVSQLCFEVEWNNRHINELINLGHKQTEVIIKLQSDLDAIHAHYRQQLCGKCGHLGVCAVSPFVKYGYKCEDRAEPVKVDLMFIELPEIKDPPATANSEEGQK